MTSLIFWGPYLAHKGIISHKREKQRVKNYERWEGLRDEYDEQRRVTRETRSLDIQRTGSWDPVTQQMTGYNSMDDNDRGIISLRDQQEANDARTGWRPQEAWESPRTQVQAQMTGQVQQLPPHNSGFSGQQLQPQRHVSAMAASPLQPQSSGLPLRSQKTGATWDEGLPAPLQVSRRSFDDHEYAQRYRPASVTSSQSGSRQPSQNRPVSGVENVSRTHTPSGLRESTQAPLPNLTQYQSPPNTDIFNIVEQPKNEFGFVDPTAAQQIGAGGRMAELIERGY